MLQASQRCLTRTIACSTSGDSSMAATLKTPRETTPKRGLVIGIMIACFACAVLTIILSIFQVSAAPKSSAGTADVVLAGELTATVSGKSVRIENAFWTDTPEEVARSTCQDASGNGLRFQNGFVSQSILVVRVEGALGCVLEGSSAVINGLHVQPLQFSMGVYGNGSRWKSPDGTDIVFRQVRLSAAPSALEQIQSIALPFLQSGATLLAGGILALILRNDFPKRSSKQGL
jgi:hypothetical protein